MSAPARLRPAHAGDLDAVAEVFRACWAGPFAAFLPPRLRGRYAGADAARALWERHVVPVVSPGLVVAEVDDAVAGVALVHPPVGYLASLYVSPAAQGSGVGSALLTHCLGRCADAGKAAMHWWVFADNAPAIAFYRSRGARPTGRTRVEDGLALPEVQLSAPTAPTRPTAPPRPARPRGGRT